MYEKNVQLLIHTVQVNNILDTKTMAKYGKRKVHAYVHTERLHSLCTEALYMYVL